MPFKSPYPQPEGFDREVLEIIAEECAEVIQRVTKALRFGLPEIQPGQPFRNSERIAHEIGNLTYMIHMALKHDLIETGDIVQGEREKERQLAKFMQHKPEGD